MNRYTVLRALSDEGTPNYLVTDLGAGNLFVVADCGNSSGMANKVAVALNAYDGGPL